MAYIDDFDLINNTLRQWYGYFSEMYGRDYMNFRYNDTLLYDLEQIIKDKKDAKRNKELAVFHHITKNNPIHIISLIVIDTLTSKSPEQLVADTYNNIAMNKFFYDLRNMYDIIQHCVKIMEYLSNKYDYLYVEHWRNKRAIEKYIDDVHDKYNNTILLFENGKTIYDLLNGYDYMTKIAYDGLIITEYIRLMNEDAFYQGDYCNEIHIFNTSHEFFYMSRNERFEFEGLEYIEESDEEYDEESDEEYVEEYHDWY